MSQKTLFKRIIDKELPAQILYEDDRCLVFNDIHPQAPTHFLVIPKKEMASTDAVAEEDKELIGHLFTVIRDLTREMGVADGYRVVTNCGSSAGQSVPHLHFHVLAGRPLTWPPG